MVMVTGTAFAQQPTVTGGIVPCGDFSRGQPPCNLCHLYTLTKNGVDFMLFDLILPVAIIALLIGGIFLLASRGNPQMIESGKNAIVNTVIGVVIAFGAWLIIATIVNTLGYDGFTAAWNVAPTCKQSVAAQGGGGVLPPPSSQCNCMCTVGGSTGFTVKDNTACSSACQANGLGDMQSCTPISTPPPPGGGGGTCIPPPNGPCSEASLKGTCFGLAGKEHEAAQICNAESANDASSESGEDRATGGNCPPSFQPNDCPHSAGLFQINFAKHSIGGLPCDQAFQPFNDNGIPRYRIVNQRLYSDCLAAAKDPKKNTDAACRVYNEAGGWSPWTVAGKSNKCGL